MMYQTEIKAPTEKKVISLEVLYNFSSLVSLYLPILCKTYQIVSETCSSPARNITKWSFLFHAATEFKKYRV